MYLHEGNKKVPRAVSDFVVAKKFGSLHRAVSGRSDSIENTGLLRQLYRPEAIPEIKAFLAGKSFTDL
jgi:hypothetical protein